MATHSSVLAWRIPGMGEPSGLLPMGSQSQTLLKRLSSSIFLDFTSKQHYMIFVFSFPGLLHSLWQSLGLSTSLQITRFRFFLWLSSSQLTLKNLPHKVREKLEFQKRKSTLSNDKLELIKISKYTHRENTSGQQHCELAEKQWSDTTQHGLFVKEKNPNMHTLTHTHTHIQMHVHKLWISATAWLNLQKIMLNRKTNSDGYILYDSIYITFWNG